MVVIAWTWFVMLLLGGCISIYDLSGEYPRKREDATPAMDLICLMVTSGLAIWIGIKLAMGEV